MNFSSLSLDEKTKILLSPEQISDAMNMDGWTLGIVYLVIWKSGLVSHTLHGVYQNHDDALMGFIERASWRHSGSKAEPTERPLPQECITPRRALIKENRFVPFGDWFDEATSDILFLIHEDIDMSDEAKGQHYMFSFGSLPDLPNDGINF